MRKWKGSAALAGVAALALSLSAMAQQGKPVTTGAEKTENNKITISGLIDLDWIQWSEMLVGLKAIEAGGPGDPFAEEAAAFQLAIRLAIDVDLTEKVSANLTLGNNDLQQGATIANSPATVGNNPETVGLNVLDASITFAELFNPAVTLRAGTQNLKFDLRGKGAFFFDPRNSESFANNVYNGEGGVGVPSGAQVDISGQDYLQPTGVTVTYKRDALLVDVILWPATIEGGRAGDDQSNVGVDFWYDLKDVLGPGSRAGGIAMITAFGGHDPMAIGSSSGASSGSTQVVTLGGGIDVMGMVKGLELYAEVYIQFGDAGNADVDPTSAGDENLDAGGMAFQVGAEFKFDNHWVAGNITVVSGDDDLDKDIDNFLSYENINDLLVFEDQFFGWDVDTNYTAIKISGGTLMSVGSGKDNLDISGIIGLITATEEIRFNGLPGAPTEDAYGTEIDVRVKYMYSKQVNVTGAFGLLTGSDVAESAGKSVGMNDPDDSMWVITLGTDLTF